MKRLRNLKIKDFKSIQDAEISFGEFNILIGANGSGKSNLVKAIEMISDIRRSGVVLAVANQGWGASIVPKKYSEEQLKEVKCSFRYTVDLGLPDGAGNIFEKDGCPTATHDIELGFPGADEVSVNSEEIVLNKIDYIGRAFNSRSSSEGATRDDGLVNVRVKFRKTKTGLVRSSLSKNYDSSSYADVVSGLGLEFLVSEKEIPRESLEKVLKQSFKERKAGLKKKYTSKSFFEMAGISSFIPPFEKLSDILARISRFDILLSNIRFEQKASFSGGLQGDGKNLPSVVKKLKEQSDVKVWSEIMETLSEIAPHIFDVSASNLATGKQYVEFSEISSVRKIESWDTSDGTLRAVSILAAVEGAPDGSILIIEEPEQNLHPWAISSLIRHIRSAISRKNLQIFITTHSQQVLESVHPGEVLVATRCLEKGTRFSRLDELVSDVDVLEVGDVGRLWVKGLLQGVPGDGI